MHKLEVSENDMSVQAGRQENKSMIWQALIVSVSLSIDALGIGISYHLKGVEIKRTAKIIIGVISAFIMYLALFVGEKINRILPGDVCNIVGISILVLMGTIFIRNALYPGEKAVCDLDQSMKIDNWEAILLALALSGDSMSAGIAFAATGLKSLLIPFGVGLMQYVFLSAGYIMAEKLSRHMVLNKKICGIFSGSLLLLIAVLRGFA